MFRTIIVLSIFALVNQVWTVPIVKPEVHNSLELNANEPKFLLTQDEDGKIAVLDLEDTKLEHSTSLKDLTYYLYTNKNPEGLKIVNNDIHVLENSSFNKSQYCVFIIHGWRNSYKSEVNTLITKALLNRFPLVNIFVVDWEVPANKNYFTSKEATKIIGKYIGEFIISLHEVYGVPFSKTVLIGHSLGAHAAGIVGRLTKGNLHRIVGLDPAGPLFSYNNTELRLDPTDATFVQVIHTNAGVLGFKDPLGHVDYYPNGGTKQPGCVMDVIGSCAHSRSYIYYADSIQGEKFSAHKCDSYEDYEKGLCKKTVRSEMGKFKCDIVDGKFYLKTRAKEPFAMEE